jgi:hypothetical protein
VLLLLLLKLSGLNDKNKNYFLLQFLLAYNSFFLALLALFFRVNGVGVMAKEVRKITRFRPLCSNFTLNGDDRGRYCNYKAIIIAPSVC